MATLTEQLNSIIKSVAGSELLFNEIQRKLRDFLSAIEENASNIGILFDALLPVFSNDGRKLGKCLLIFAILSNNKNKLRKCLEFLERRSLLNDKEILEVLFSDDSDNSSIPFVIEVLVSNWSIERVLRAINSLQSKIMQAAIQFLVKVNPDSENFHKHLLRYSWQFSSLFELIIHNLNKQTIAHETMILYALQFEEPARENVARSLIDYLRRNKLLNLDKIIRLIFERGRLSMEYLIGLLFKTSVLDWNRIDTLLNFPLRLYPPSRVNEQQPGQLQGLLPGNLQDLFDLLFRILLNLAKVENVLEAFFKEFINWINNNQDIKYNIGISRVINFGDSTATITAFNDFDAVKKLFEIPLSIWLFGLAFGSYIGRGANNTILNFNAIANLPVTMVLVRVLIPNGQPNNPLLLALITVPGVLAILLPALVDFATHIPMRFISWIGQDVRDINEQPGNRKLEIIELPTAGNNEKPGTRYMIFSDMHRDLKSDQIDPVLWDTTHFSKNTEIYKTALNYCHDNGYIVIENGDCEEFWFRPKIFIDETSARASQFANDHSDVYSLLKKLYDSQIEIKDENGNLVENFRRYYRTRGNHDNWWVLQANNDLEMKKVFSDNFKIYDAFIIPGVKSMDDPLLGQILDIISSSNQNTILQNLINIIPLGLSPDRYTDTKPMFGFHGHQVDFWNCDEHYFLGYFFANAFGVPADISDSLPYYLKGIDISGNPLCRFPDALIALTPWNNWMPEHHSRKMAREIEFMPETDRKLQDTVMFSETLAASLSILLGVNIGQVCDYNTTGVQILTGHTHNPQSRPYLKIPLTPQTTINESLKYLDNVKVPYFNSGTGSWFEGIIWAIEITEKGQPRLVYWDKNSKSPQVMGWELHDNLVITPTDLTSKIKYLNSLLQSAGNTVSNSINVSNFLQIPRSETIQTEQFPGFNVLRNNVNFNFETIEDFIAIPKLLLDTLKDTVCDMARQPIRITLPIHIIPIGSNSITGELPLSNFLNNNETVEQIFDKWMEYLSIRWGVYFNSGNFEITIDADKMKDFVGVFFYIAYLFRSGVFNNLGMIFLIAIEKSNNFEIRYSRNQKTLELRF